MAQNIGSAKTGWVGKNGGFQGTLLILEEIQMFNLTRTELIFILCYEIPFIWPTLFTSIAF